MTLLEVVKILGWTLVIILIRVIANIGVHYGILPWWF